MCTPPRSKISLTAASDASAVPSSWPVHSVSVAVREIECCDDPLDMADLDPDAFAEPDSDPADLDAEPVAEPDADPRGLTAESDADPPVAELADLAVYFAPDRDPCSFAEPVVDLSLFTESPSVVLRDIIAR